MAEPLDESERYFASSVTAMLAEGYTAQRLRWLITCSQLNFRHDAQVQDRREALHVVDDGPSGDG